MKKYIMILLFILISAIMDIVSKPKAEESYTTFLRPIDIGQITYNKQVVYEYKYTYGWPIDSEDYMGLSSPYGERNPNEIGGYGDYFHDGTDMYGTWKARIIAIDDGVIIDKWFPPGTIVNGKKYNGHKVFGGYIVIQHSNGVVSRYAHLEKTLVHEGQIVKKGDLIGRQGNTGKSMNAHLHFELLIDGVHVNPLRYIGQ